MTDKIKITADRIIKRGKGEVKFYDDNGAIKTLPSKQVQVIEPGGEQIAAEDSRRDYEAEEDATVKAEGDEQPVSNDAQAADSSPAAAPVSSKKRGAGKKGAAMATKKKGGAKKKAASKGNGMRLIGGREHDISGYEKSKSASGHTSFDNGDSVATKLRGKTLDEVYAFAAKTLKEDEKELRKKYKALNVGMQRMSLGNRLRKVLQPKAA